MILKSRDKEIRRKKIRHGHSNHRTRYPARMWLKIGVPNAPSLLDTTISISEHAKFFMRKLIQELADHQPLQKNNGSDSLIKRVAHQLQSGPNRFHAIKTNKLHSGDRRVERELACCCRTLLDLKILRRA